MAELQALFGWMQQLLSHPRGISAAEAELADSGYSVAKEFCSSEARSAEDRLAMMGRMILWRLIDVLVEDYPATRALLGDELFTQRARAFLSRHPARHYNLSELGRRFPGFLAAGAQGGCLYELARLERGISEVFHAPRDPQLGGASLAQLPPQAWAATRLRLARAVRLFAFRFPVDQLFQATRDGKPVQIPAPRRSWLLLCRRELTVRRVPLQRAQFTLLEALSQGHSLATALQRCAASADPKQLASLGTWFQRWTALGLFLPIEEIFEAVC